jgi:hypothetical protein
LTRKLGGFVGEKGRGQKRLVLQSAGRSCSESYYYYYDTVNTARAQTLPVYSTPSSPARAHASSSSLSIPTPAPRQRETLA